MFTPPQAAPPFVPSPFATFPQPCCSIGACLFLRCRNWSSQACQNVHSNPNVKERRRGGHCRWDFFSGNANRLDKRRSKPANHAQIRRASSECGIFPENFVFFSKDEFCTYHVHPRISYVSIICNETTRSSC